MDRKEFTRKLALLGACPFVVAKLYGSETKTPADEDLNVVQAKKQFVENWLADLLESIEINLIAIRPLSVVVVKDPAESSL